MDQLRKKLLDFTETPPPGVWASVESALEQELPAVGKKLAAYSANPPASLWEKIESNISEKKKRAPVVLFRNKFSRLAAAAVILFAVFLGVRLFTPSADTNEITALPQDQSPTPLPATNEQDDTVAVEQPSSKKDPVVKRAMVKAPQPKRPEKNPAIAKKNRYTTMSNEDGQTVRLSKKIAPVFDCAEAKIRALSFYCKQNIKLMQEKVGSSISPSADFAGLIDMLQTLEEDK